MAHRDDAQPGCRDSRPVLGERPLGPLDGATVRRRLAARPADAGAQAVVPLRVARHHGQDVPRHLARRPHLHQAAGRGGRRRAGPQRRARVALGRSVRGRVRRVVDAPAVRRAAHGVDDRRQARRRVLRLRLARRRAVAAAARRALGRDGRPLDLLPQPAAQAAALGLLAAREPVRRRAERPHARAPLLGDPARRLARRLRAAVLRVPAVPAPLLSVRGASARRAGAVVRDRQRGLRLPPVRRVQRRRSRVREPPAPRPRHPVGARQRRRAQEQLDPPRLLARRLPPRSAAARAARRAAAAVHRDAADVHQPGGASRPPLQPPARAGLSHRCGRPPPLLLWLRRQGVRRSGRGGARHRRRPRVL
mmetsp:Transcript_26074/g.69563  ORF Transcript_26074/g.69563 Transcript_26074/m.69563 type:complete len:364 (-) Transcript_26074:763-1854(-)